MMTKVLLTFKKLSDAGLQGKAAFIISSMTGNASFPTPTPALTALQTALDAYGDALNASQTGDKTSVAVKNDKRDSLTALLQQLAVYVTLIANGDRAMLVSSGFEVSKDAPSPVVLGSLENFKVEPGLNPGEMSSSINSGSGSRFFNHMYSADPELKEQSWITKSTTTCKALFTNLAPGTKYWFRVLAVGSNNQVVYSDVISRIAV